MSNHRSRIAATFALILIAASAFAQTKSHVQRHATTEAQSQAPTPGIGLPQELDKYPGLLPAFGELFEKLQRNVQFPPARSQSRLLPLIPDTSAVYMAMPNYGESLHQALNIFHQELQRSAVLREWWQDSDVAKSGPKIENALEVAYQLSQYLGDEIVISAAAEHNEPGNVLVIAEVRKAGIKPFLQRMSKELGNDSKSALRVVEVQELAGAQENRPGQNLLVLVRPDYVVAAMDLATLRSFNERLDRKASDFASTAFGQRIARSYEGGATVVGAIDLQRVISQIPGTAKDATFQQTGFSDAQYLVWEHKIISGQDVSQAELSFTGPRHGIASWLAPPIHPGSLEFVSPKAVLVTTLALTSPAKIFEQIQQLSTANPKAFNGVAQMEQALNLRLKDDLLNYLGGEVTVEVDNATPPQPAARVILRVKDAARLQQTLTTLLASMNLRAQRSVESGVTYFDVQVPASNPPIQPAYAFVDGYLVIASSHDAVAESVRLHRTGTSLAKSPKFLASLPRGHESGMSAMVYQDPVAMMTLRMRAFAPAMASNFSRLAGGESAPTVVAFYGEESAIREASTNAAVDVGTVLVVAAIAIPNLLRARTSTNEATAVGKMRTLTTAQAAYASTYPDRGFARDLAMLGPGADRGEPSPEHAGLIDATLGNPNCAPGAWCAESAGYRFSLKGICLQGHCTEYLALATPISSNTGSRSFCSTANGVIHYQVGPPLSTPVGVSECRKWPPLK